MSTIPRYCRLAAASLGLLGLFAPPAARAGLTDIATAPLFTTSTTVVKPNVMFVLDDSGSMAWDFMPDDADFNTSTFTAVYGRRAAQCNGLGFNEVEAAAPYTAPVDATGTTVGPASMDFLSGTQVSNVNYLPSGFVTNTGNKRSISSPTTLNMVGGGSSVKVTVSGAVAGSYFPGMVVSLFGSYLDSRGRVVYDSSKYMIGKVSAWSGGELTVDVAMAVGSGTLSSIYVGDGSPIDNVYYTYSGTAAALSYNYASNTLDTNSTFYKECVSAITSDPGKSVFTAHIVTPGSAIAQRYANWYHYYSTRMRMMKTSLTTAFKDLDDKYRIGFSTINESTALPTLDIADFGSNQKVTFYSDINAAVPSGNTPLRAALSKAGRYYAKKLTNQTNDPVQYSCQKNFTILSTDGYWNSTAGSKLDGSTAVDQQDGAGTERPMFDGGISTTKTVETWRVTSTYQRTTVTPYTQTATTTTTTYTPTKGETYTGYTLGTLSRQYSNSSVSRSCDKYKGNEVYPCTVTVTTSANHGLSTGQSITLAGVSPSGYNGARTITVTGSKTYQFTLTGTGTPLASPTAAGTTTYAPDNCPVGQGLQTSQVWTRDQRNVSTTVDKVASSWTQTDVVEWSTTTSYTRTITVVNGTQQSDVTTTSTGTPTSRLLSSTNSTKNSVPTSNTTPSTDTTAWVASGSPGAGVCVGTKTADTTPVIIATTTQAQTTRTSDPGTAAAGTGTSTDTTPVDSATAKTTTTTTTSSGGSTDSLADVAMYYYQTDLRDSALGNCTGALGTSVCTNNVSAIGSDNAATQHMSTYTLSLGMSGTLKYDPNYESQSTGDYADIKLGTKNWPVPSSNGGPVNIDDLWHAAVNGRGRYFSATDPTTLASSLAAALNSIKAVVGSSSAAATSTLQPVEGDNGVYIAQFKSSEWTGDLRSYKIDIKTGAVPTTKIDAKGNAVDLADWSAGDQLSPSTTRNIYYFKAGSGNAGSLREFTYANLSADGLNSAVDNACSKPEPLTQCTGASAAMLGTLNSGANMVSFLRGQAQAQYRTRAKVLGDIVNSSPVYVGKPSFLYTENGYGSYKTAQAARAPTLYVGANDGMLHAFDASNGQERWAYVPALLLNKLYKLGDQFYESKHQYFVDATPAVGDIHVSSGWKTILVGGLNAGGSGYYALDVTDPANPVALWEFKHANMGLSYGNPIITKRADGTWVVVVSSGYNNADGEGHLFVLDAQTGALLKQVSTGVGSAGSPSGLGRLNAWIDSDVENLAKRFYGGDLLGNVWRFDIDDLVEPKSSAFKLAQLLVDGVPQPITTTPQLAEVQANGGSYKVVYVGTGQYLGTSDVNTTGVQSIYAIKDELGSTSLGDVRGGGSLVPQTVVTSGKVRTVDAANPVDWSSKNGWYVDLVSQGERINVDMQLAFGMLTAAGNIPGNAATDCKEADRGTSWIYQLNIVTGKGSSDNIDSMVAGVSTVQLPKGTGVSIVTKTDASQPLPKTIQPSQQGTGEARRSSWRELID